MKKSKIFILITLLASSGCMNYRLGFNYQAPDKKFKVRVQLPDGSVQEIDSKDLEKVKVTSNDGKSVEVPIDKFEKMSWHSVDIRFRSFLMWGKASKLTAETQTEEFLHSINGTGIAFGVETNAVKAITEGVSQAVTESIKKSFGVP